jgi:hypothetical protein
LTDPSDFWFAVWMLVVAIAGGGWFALRWLHVARMIEDTPTSRIRSAAQGYVELAGRCGALDGSRNLAPLTQRPCVWWRYRVQRRTGSASRGSRRTTWQTVSAGRSEQPFLLDDGTGQCIVQPAGAEVLTGESTTWYGDTPWPTQLPGRGLTGTLSGEREYRYFEERIYEHEQVCVLGGFRTHTAAGLCDAPAEVAALLAEWKQDQAHLAARFDSDGDGQVSLAEWERARAEARQAVEQRHLEAPARPALHSIGRPEGGRLYLIAAFAEADVARRYRRRAMAAFAGFAAATCALGWLLQGVFG